MPGSTTTGSKREHAAQIAEDRLHKGDMVFLQAGDLVLADLELVEARGLEVDEWELTGELRPVEKRVGEEAAYLYRGSRVTRGSGRGIVVATGVETEYGEILKQPWELKIRKLPPLIKRQSCILLVLLLPPFLAALGRHDGNALTLLLCLATAVVLVLLQNSELFRYLLTSSEARRLEARGIDIRDATCLDDVSRLDVVCLDKTGILTTLDIEVGGLHFAGETPDAVSFLPDDKRGTLTGIACALCNDVFFLERRHQADPIDKALISFALQHGFDIDQLAAQYKRVYDKPFDSEDRYMAAGFELGSNPASSCILGEKTGAGACSEQIGSGLAGLGDQTLYFVKGDPEFILKMCTGYMTASGSVRNVDGDFLVSIKTATDSANQQGDIAVALGYSPGTAIPPKRYTFLCLIQLQNPLRPGVPDEVRWLKDVGIRPIMLTGDRPEAAMAIGKKAGIGPDSSYCLTGKAIAQMALEEVARQAAYVSIFARLLPSQKGILVRLLQERGHSVAMVGDGANDTVALRVADVGISFGKSSSPLAKRVSRILIQDLADLLTIIAGAKRIERWFKCFMLFRVAALISMPVGLYAWMLG